MDGSITGRIGNAADGDFFRFSLAATGARAAHARATARCDARDLPGWRRRRAHVRTRHTVPGKAVELDLVLPAGDHAVRVVGPADDERYRLSLRREYPFDLTADQEPNDQVATARPLRAGVRAEGSVEPVDPADWYALGPLPASGELTVTTEGRIRSLVVHDGLVELPLTSVDGATYVSPPFRPVRTCRWGSSRTGRTPSSSILGRRD